MARRRAVVSAPASARLSARPRLLLLSAASARASALVAVIRSGFIGAAGPGASVPASSVLSRACRVLNHDHVDSAAK